MEHMSRNALLLGCFTRPNESDQRYFCLSENAKLFNQNLKGALMSSLTSDGPFSEDKRIKLCQFGDPTVQEYVKRYDKIAVVSLGPKDVPAGLENTDVQIENIISGIVLALKLLETQHFDTVYIDSCGYPKIVGTAVALITPVLNKKSKTETCIRAKYFDEFHFGGGEEYELGIILGNGQIKAQELMKSPSIMNFVKTAENFLSEFDVKFTTRTLSWMSEKKMLALLGVCRNSIEQPIILEITYNGVANLNQPLVLVGKATPYENSSVALCYKSELHQFQYRTGMGGASCIIGALYSLCKMKAPVKVHCVLALVWNKFEEKPIKKGEVIRAMNGVTIQVDRPEAEGRLIMADVLSYADTMDSTAVVDVTSLSSNIDSLIGNSYIAFFTSDDYLKQVLLQASRSSGEKVWQLPLFKHFKNLLKVSTVADISNGGRDFKSVTACKSAAFLREFISEKRPWIHLDISAVCECKGRRNYLHDWATGRSTRLLAEFCIEYFLNYNS